MNDAAAGRLAEVRRLRVLETAPEHDFDLIAQAAAALFDAPVALVSLLDADRVWFKAAAGTSLRPIDLDAAFSLHALQDPSTVMVVPDAALDARFQANPSVTGGAGIRFYAGAPLVSSNGYALGTLCVFGRKPHAVSSSEIETLRSLAALTIRSIERRADVISGRDDRRRLAMLESVVGNSTDAVIVTDAGPASDDGRRIIFVNDAFTRMTGYTAAEAIGGSPAITSGPRTDPAELARIADALRLRAPVRSELINYRKDRSEFRVELSVFPICGEDGECLYFVAIERDVTQRRALEKYDDARGVVLEMAVCNEPLDIQLNRIVVLLKDVIAGSCGTIMFVDGGVLVGAAADPHLPVALLAKIERMPIGPAAGSCGAAVYERSTIICSDIATDPRWQAYCEPALAAGFRSCWSMPLFGAHGDVVGTFALYIDRMAAPTPQELQLFEQTVSFASLVIERQTARERLERLVLYDALTELPNRKLFEIRFAAAAARARAVGDAIAIGVLDLDRFKTINDAYGHHVGDELLRSIAARLSASLREGDCIARMAGDEFLVMFPDLANQTDGAAAAARLLAQFDAPFAAAGREVFVRPSLGLAFFPDTSRELLELLVAADGAMDAAKARGGGIERATGAVTGALKKLDFDNDLRHALERAEFELYYQVMFDLIDGRPVGAEALLRWHHPRFGTISPGDFIPLAEANGTIVPIGKWVIDEATRVARGWQNEGRDAFVTVNVSALQFDEPGLVTTVVDALRRHGLEPHRLHLELTESLIMRNPAASMVMLAQLKAHGVRIVIDDFGTGYSSLAYLQQFAFDALKIDRAFVRDICDGDTGRSAQIVTALVALGEGLGVTTIAEGVEDSAQYAQVKSCGCDVVQGFLCALPVAANAIDWQHRDGSQNAFAYAYANDSDVVTRTAKP